MFQINTNIGFMLLHAAGELIKKIQYASIKYNIL